MKVKIKVIWDGSPWGGNVEDLKPRQRLFPVTALQQLQLFQRLLWVLGFLAGFLGLLLGLGACYSWR